MGANVLSEWAPKSSLTTVTGLQDHKATCEQNRPPAHLMNPENATSESTGTSEELMLREIASLDLDVSFAQ